jgi:uncharacterized membrane protein
LVADNDIADATTRDSSVTASTEEPVRRFIQLVLRGGLALSFVLMVVGLVLKAVGGDGSAPATPLFSLGAEGAVGDTVMAVGILVLAATPAIRVLSLIVLWAREKDWHYTGVAVVVLVVLAAAAAIGHG